VILEEGERLDCVVFDSETRACTVGIRGVSDFIFIFIFIFWRRGELGCSLWERSS
jgi:hypothetical protein